MPKETISDGSILVTTQTLRGRMANQQLILAVSTFTVVLLGLWLLQHLQQKRKYNLPPRVPGIPIFGNTFQIPALQQGPWAKKLAEKYGEMFVARELTFGRFTF